MLAHVFWHWKRPGVIGRDYGDSLRRFHAALRAAPSAGLDRSWTAAISGATWVPAASDAYEDWYLVDGSAALDLLNDAAITASRQQPHDAVAALAEGGTAGLYRLRAGRALTCPAHALWFSKPADMTHATLLDAMARVTQGLDVALWCRQMALGPTPEFCLHAPHAVTQPAEVRGTPVALRPIWP